jgi:mRNA interferase MazF
MSRNQNRRSYIPERNDIVFVDFEPVKGKEIGKLRPALVLSTKNYNQKSGLMICCPISTQIRGGDLEVSVDNLDQPSVVCPNLVTTLDWKERKASFKVKATTEVVDETLLKLLALLPAEEAFARLEEEQSDDKTTGKAS